jgi:hypothetical protein
MQALYRVAGGLPRHFNYADLMAAGPPVGYRKALNDAVADTTKRKAGRNQVLPEPMAIVDEDFHGHPAIDRIAFGDAASTTLPNQMLADRTKGAVDLA